MKEFDQLVKHFIESDQLGDYNKENYSITLYDIKNDPNTLFEIIQCINSITNKYKFVVLSQKEEYTNIKILDINL